MLGREALVMFSQLSQVIADKREEPILQRTGVGKQTNHNCRCEVLLTDDQQSSFPQSSAGMGAGLGSGIGNQVGGLNCTPV